MRISTRHRLIPSLFLAFMLVLFPRQVEARGAVDLPSLETFIEQVQNGEADMLRGVYVPDVLASPVIQQPETSPAYVSSNDNTLTQFGLASHYGSTGLLAHNYLAGADFFLVEQGQVLYLVYGDGRVETFTVTGLKRFRALEPENTRGHFIDLETGAYLSAAKLFFKIYNQPGKVILQTCIQANGEPSWGRYFLIAEPVPADDLDPAP